VRALERVAAVDYIFQWSRHDEAGNEKKETWKEVSQIK
jgi:hypothetical protein